MLYIKSVTANDAWRQTLLALYDEATIDGNAKYIRDEVALIEITNPAVQTIDPHFPMKQEDIDVINRYIYTGENEEAVIHDWTKLYYHRAFDEPNSQIEFLISNLSQNNPVGEAQISMWDKTVDQKEKISPCTQIVWARIKRGKLELHVHAHSSDAYKKLLMNMLEFISLQYYIADRVGVQPGSYYHFLDSCHMHASDLSAIERVVDELR